MFNKKLKEQLMMLKHENDTLWDKVNDDSWKQEKQEKEVECLNRIIEAQGLLLTYFSSYIVENDVKNKKVQTKTIKIKMKKGKK